MDDSVLFERIQALYEHTSSEKDHVDACTSPSSTLTVDLKRGRNAWTEEQDAEIVEALRTHGCKWRQIARHLNMASDDAIRNRVLRWKPESLDDDVRAIVSHLHKARDKPKRESSVVHRAYTPEEDQAILDELHYGDGSRSWQKLKKGVLSCRTTHSIRNRAYRLVSSNGYNLDAHRKVRKSAISSTTSMSAMEM